MEGAFSNAIMLVSVVNLAAELLREISPKFFESVEPLAEMPEDHLGRSLANALYGATDLKAASLPETEGRELLTSGFATALRLAERCANEVINTTGPTLAPTKLLMASLSTIFTLSAASLHSDETLQLAWDPEAVTDAFVRCLQKSEAKVSLFSAHAAIISAILTLAKTPNLQPPLRRNRRPLVEALASKVSAVISNAEPQLTLLVSNSCSTISNPLALLASSSRYSYCGVSRSSPTVAISSR